MQPSIRVARAAAGTRAADVEPGTDQPRSRLGRVSQGRSIRVTHGSPRNTIIGGKIRYTPDTGFAGVDTFTYVIRNGKNVTDTGDVTVTVTDPNVKVEHAMFLPLVDQ